MKQLKISKNIDEILKLPIEGIAIKENFELLTLDGYRIIVENREVSESQNKTKENKSLFGVFSHAKVSEEDINESKKIFECEI